MLQAFTSLGIEFGLWCAKEIEIIQCLTCLIVHHCGYFKITFGSYLEPAASWALFSLTPSLEPFSSDKPGLPLLYRDSLRSLDPADSKVLMYKTPL